MPVVPLPIPDFLGGVSQQAPAQRLPNQLEACDNAWASPQDGLIKRHPFLHRAVVDSMVGDLDRLLHPIDRDATERYAVDVTQDGIRVFDLDGNEFPVVMEDGSDPDFTYLRLSRTDLFDDHEDFGTDWVVTDMIRTVGDFRGPYTKGRPRIYTATDPTDGTATQALNVIGLSAPAGDTWGMSVRFKKDPDAAADADVTLGIEFNDAGFPRADAVFTWVGDDLVAGATSWDGTNDGTIASSSTDLGDGWFQATVVVKTTDIVAADAGWIVLPAGTAGRSVALFGAQFIRNCPADPELFPSYFLDEARAAFTATTFADTTFIANRAVPIAFTDDDLAEYTVPGGVTERAFIWIRQGGYGQRYSIKITTETGGSYEGGTVVITTPLADGTSPPNDPGDATAVDGDSPSIAAAFATALNAVSSTHWTVTANGAVLIIDTDSGHTFIELDLEDSLAGKGMVLIQETVPALEDLPTRFVDGYRVKIVGVASRPEDDFWVVFVRTAADDSTFLTATPFGDGVWEESGEPGLATTLDPTTLPHVMVRMQDDPDGTATGIGGSLFFTFDEYEWDDRLVGDDVTNPVTNLVGALVGDIGFFRSRLYMIFGRSVLLSGTNHPGRLFRTTVRSLPDTDPIQVEIPDRNVASFHHALPLDRELAVFSDSAVYRLTGSPVLTPSTVAADTALELTSDRDARAHRFGDTAIAFGRADGETTTYQVLIPDDSQGGTVRYAELSAPAPRFVPSRAASAAASSAANAVAVVPLDDPTALYWFQQFLSPGGERLQASWFRYPFPDGAVPIAVTFVRRALCLLIERAGQVCLEVMEITPLPADDDLGYQVKIDRRLTEGEVIGAVYDSGTDSTTVTVPYRFQEDGLADGPGRPVLVTREIGTGTGGRRPEVVGTTLATVRVLGDYSSEPFFVGERYDMVAELTPPYYRTTDRSGAPIPFLRGPQRVLSVAVQFVETAHFQIAVNPPLRAESRTVWNTPLGVGATIGPADPVDGEVRTSVLVDHADAVVTLENPSPFPSRFTSAEWELSVRPRQ